MRNRIKEHRKVRASDLRPHPLNFRVHPESQKAVMGASLSEVGFARSLVAYEDPEHGLTLIDGHLRRDQVGDAEVTVEILDVTEEEARKLLLSLDPMAALAGTDEAALRELLDTTDAEEPALRALWEGIGDEPPSPDDEGDGGVGEADGPRQHLVLIECKSEAHQAEVLARCQKSGWKSKPLMS